MHALRREAVMDRLSPLDAVFVDAEDEDRHTSMAIASIAVFEGPAPSYDDFYQAVARRLPLVPIYGTVKLHLSGTKKPYQMKGIHGIGHLCQRGSLALVPPHPAG